MSYSTWHPDHLAPIDANSIGIPSGSQPTAPFIAHPAHAAMPGMAEHAAVESVGGPGNPGRPIPRNPSGDYNSKVYAERNKTAAAVQTPEEAQRSQREGEGFVRSNEGIMNDPAQRMAGTYDPVKTPDNSISGATPSMAGPKEKTVR